MDCQETFFPVCQNSILILLSVAINQGWSLHQVDVSNAILYNALSETIYMEQPPDYVVEGEFDKVCFLHRALYGLKQSL